MCRPVMRWNVNLPPLRGQPARYARRRPNGHRRHWRRVDSVMNPSQGAGRADLVKALCKGAVAMGADALLIEVHPNPAEAWSDGAQQVSLDLFAKLMTELKPFIAAAGRE